MAEITSAGVTGTTLKEYLAEIQARYEAIDPDWNIEPETPDGQAISIWAETLALLDEQVQYAYMSRDPATAMGQALNDIATYAGLERQRATFSTAAVILSGVSGTVVPAGYRVRNATTGTTWALDSEVVIDGPTAANVTATVRGALPASIGALSEIADPVAGWQAVTNAQAAAIGRDEESDNQYRLRRNRSVALPGRNQVDNIFASVSNVDGVTQVRVYENPEDAPDQNGLARNSIAIFVQGGDVAEIQTAIATRKNPGCGMNRYSGFPNTISQDTVTPLGNPVNITFFRPELVTIHVAVTINTTAMSEATKETIKQAIVDFSLEGFIPSEGFTKRGFRIGERVAAGKLYTPVNNIVGDQGATESIMVGMSPDPTGAVVPIAFNQLGVFDVANIEVEYVT